MTFHLDRIRRQLEGPGATDSHGMLDPMTPSVLRPWEAKSAVPMSAVSPRTAWQA